MSVSESCPYCDSPSDCPHLLLLVDQTFRTATGGMLKRAFNLRWSAMCEAGGDTFDEREPFESLLDEVNDLADASNEYDFDGGPGASSAYINYFAKSEAAVSEALKRFTASH